MPIYITPSGWTAVTGVAILAVLAGVGVLAYASAIAGPPRVTAEAAPAVQASAVPAPPPPNAVPTPAVAPLRPAKPVPPPAAPAKNKEEPVDPIKALASIVPSRPRPVPAPADVPAVRSPLAEPTFRMTAGRYSDRDNIERAVTHELGDAYRVADWNDLTPYRNKIDLWMATTGMQQGEENSLWVTKNGSRDWNGRRRYFITRFDGRKVGDYLAHESIANDTICLGSWYNISYRVLAIRK